MNSDRPNILWICSDQQRFDTLGCYGNAFVRTPNIDRLAQGGVLFEYAYSQSTICTPSRSSFLTGRYPRTTACRDNGRSIPEHEVLVTKLLADAGYTCGLSGKLHVSACHPSICKAREPRIDDGYHEFHWSHHPPQHWPTNEYHHWLRGRGAAYGVREFADSPYVRLGMPAEHHQTTYCAEMAINFIEANAGRGQPWLFSVNFFDPHHPFDPPEEFLERYRAVLDDIPLPRFRPGELDDKPPWQKRAHTGNKEYPFERMSERDHRWLRAAYWAMCDLIDVQVGRMLEALERTGQIDDTIVIYMSDHGEMLGDHGIYLKGPHFYEPAVHVPLIVSWPGKVAPRRSSALVELVDLAPTLLDMCGLDIHPGMQGASVWPLLRGDQPVDRHRDDVYAEFYRGDRPGDPAPHTTMVRTNRYKLTVAHGRGIGELYDLENDPGESYNLWADPRYAGVKMDMLIRMTDRMAYTCDPLPPKRAPW